MAGMRLPWIQKRGHYRLEYSNRSPCYALKEEIQKTKEKRNKWGGMERRLVMKKPAAADMHGFLFLFLFIFTRFSLFSFSLSCSIIF
jgi:hypothetical protein